MCICTHHAHNMCECVCLHMCIVVVVRRQLLVVGSLFEPCGFEYLKSGHQASGRYLYPLNHLFDPICFILLFTGPNIVVEIIICMWFIIVFIVDLCCQV